MDLHRQIAELEAKLAARDAQLAERDAHISELRQQVVQLLESQRVLTEKLGANSRNSNKPPSSDPPGTSVSGTSKNKEKRERRQRKQRKRGGQPGHKGNHRSLLPESEVNEFVDFYPKKCEGCWSKLPEILDLHASRFQVTEVPPIVPHVTEYRCHSVTCECGVKTRAEDVDVPSSAFGPRLMSVTVLLTGVYHVSRRKTVTLLSDLLGVAISVGAVSAIEKRVSEAIKPAFEEAWSKVPDSPVKHADGTSWRQCNVLMSLWVVATAMFTVFKIIKSGNRATLEPLLGPARGILVSDRDSSLTFWAMKNRQICWAHLLRKFVLFSERDGPAGAIGREFLSYTSLVFEYWHAQKAGEITRKEFQSWMAPVRIGFETLLARASAAGIRGLSGCCANMAKHKEALWTFVDNHGVEPTNNHAERELRAFVMWRRRCFGAQSERGNDFAERIMTIAHTARKQERDVLRFLEDSCNAVITGDAAPSLFHTAAIQAAA